MAKILGMEFAPLNIPLHRRIETACVFQWVISFLFGGFGCLGLYIYLLFTKYYWICLLYLCWYAYDRSGPDRGSRPLRFIRFSSVWRWMARYFPAKLHKTADLDPNKSYIFGLHPHGIFHTSGFLSFGTEGTGFQKLFPGIMPHLLILAGQFKFPFWRDYLQLSGVYLRLGQLKKYPCLG